MVYAHIIFITKMYILKLMVQQTFILVIPILKCQCPLCAGIPGDGRCLFRSVAHGACIRSGKPAPSENLQRELADDLRSKVSFLHPFILIMRSLKFCFCKKHECLLPDYHLSFCEFVFFFLLIFGLSLHLLSF